MRPEEGGHDVNINKKVFKPNKLAFRILRRRSMPGGLDFMSAILIVMP